MEKEVDSAGHDYTYIAENVRTEIWRQISVVCGQRSYIYIAWYYNKLSQNQTMYVTASHDILKYV